MLPISQLDNIVEGILDFPRESIAVEFKSAFAWPNSRDALKSDFLAVSIIKTVMGMANNKAGGRIIIGVSQEASKQLVLTGLTQTQLESFDQEIIHDQITSTADPKPKVDISCMEYQGNKYVILTVGGLDGTPSVCVKTMGVQKGPSSQIEEGSTYIRNNKPETKKITQPEEFRHLINELIQLEFEIWSPRLEMLLGKLDGRTVNSKPVPGISDKSKYESEMKDLLG